MKIVIQDEQMTITTEENWIGTLAAELQAELLSNMEQFKTGNVFLDLSQTDFMDSLGIKLVVGLIKSCQEKNLSFEIINCSASILRLFRIFNLDKLANIRQEEKVNA